jgi:hypothetical protein
MGQTPEDQKVGHAEGTTSGDEEAESLKMVDVVNLLQGNLIRTTRLMWGQFLVIGGLIFFLFIIYFSLLSKIPSISNVAVSGQKSLEKPSPASEIISAPQVPQTEAAVRSTDVPERKEVQSILDQIRKAQLEKNINR